MKPGDPGDERGGRRPRARPDRSQVDTLKAELRARIAEADWLKSHYDEQLRAAFAQVESLHVRLMAATTPVHEAVEAEREQSAEVDRIKVELDRLLAAEERYLDRIDELKQMVGRNDSSD